MVVTATTAEELGRYRVSWGAVLAGSVLALVTYLALSTLGTAIGLSALDLAHESRPFEGFSTGAFVWLLVSTLVSVFVGGYVAGLFAVSRGALHGLLSWAITTLLTVWLLAGAVGGVLSATTGVVGKGLSLVGDGVAASAPKAVDAVKGQLAEQGVRVDWDSLQGELDTLLRQTGKAELQPEALKAKGNQVAEQTEQQAGQAAQAPQAADQDLAAWFDRVRAAANPTVAAADRDALVNVITARTGKSHEEAEQIADRYVQAYNQAMQRFQELKQQAEQKARQAGDVAAEKVAQAAWFSLIVMVAGALVGAVAGALGRRRVRTRTI